MKFLRLFICQLIIVLSITPCTDAAVTQSNLSLSSFSKVDIQHSDDTFHADVCSPFCVCTCCNMPTLLQSTKTPAQVIRFILAQYPVEKNKKAQTAFIEFWQPPKLA
ncbi:DUF6660 family protein [Pedobacter sp. MW01-1-1]|uniref:DUF6660 family protein n=1 Tax=Pedobacter sp. MW01-1-1 TaxID=3383027 RepID=UPI003FF09A24